MSQCFMDLNEKRAALRAAQQPEPQTQRLFDRFRQLVAEVLYRIRRPSLQRPGSTAHAGASVRDAMTDAARADLDAIELDWFGGERMSREWMKNGNAAGSVVPGSYEDEVFGRRQINAATA